MFFGASPDRARFEDLRRYQLHLVAERCRCGRPSTIPSRALRFLFTVTLRRPQSSPLALIREPRRLPIVLSPDEVARLLDAAPSLKYKAALSVGLWRRDCVPPRSSRSKVEDIDSAPDGHPGSSSG